MKTITPLIALIRKDLILYLSNRRALVLSLLMPVILGAFFGFLFGGANSSERVKLDVALVLQDDSALGQKIAAALKEDANLQVQDMDLATAKEKVGKGKLSAAIVIPAGFAQAARAAMQGAQERPALPVLYDPSHQMEMSMAKGMVTQKVMHAISADLYEGKNVTAPALPFSINEELTSSNPSKYNGYAHSFSGMAVQFILFMGIEVGIGILLARRMGMWNRMLAAPVSMNTLLLARVISSAVISFGVLLAIFAIAVAVFKVRIDGSLPGLLGVGFCFAVMAATFGLLIASLGKTPEAARSLATFATLIMVMLGGAWVPSYIFPQWLQTATLIMPTRWAVDGLEAMTWRGLGFDAALPAMGVQLGFAILFGAVAMWKFRR
ncbi:MAG: ABC transporter permease [Pseudomonadota bacterium]